MVLGTVQCVDWGHMLGRRTDRLVSVHSKTITIRGGLRLVDKHADVFRWFVFVPHYPEDLLKLWSFNNLL